MARSIRLQPAVAVLVLFALLAAWAPAAEARESTASNEPGHREPGLVAQLWELWFLWIENGCSVDPDGRCAGEAVADETATQENGCSLDPDGRCFRGTAAHETDTRDEGCSLDPSGGCGR